MIEEKEFKINKDDRGDFDIDLKSVLKENDSDWNQIEYETIDGFLIIRIPKDCFIGCSESQINLLESYSR